MVKTFPIKDNRNFLKIYKKGRFFVGRYLVLYTMPNKLFLNRIGITAGKKSGNSVRRNRIRRLIRENYRLYEHFIKDGIDILFVVRPSEKLPGFHDIRKEMKFLLKKLEIFDQERWDCLKQS